MPKQTSALYKQIQNIDRQNKIINTASGLVGFGLGHLLSNQFDTSHNIPLDLSIDLGSGYLANYMSHKLTDSRISDTVENSIYGPYNKKANNLLNLVIYFPVKISEIHNDYTYEKKSDVLIDKFQKCTNINISKPNYISNYRKCYVTFVSSSLEIIGNYVKEKRSHPDMVSIYKYLVGEFEVIQKFLLDSKPLLENISSLIQKKRHLHNTNTDNEILHNASDEEIESSIFSKTLDASKKKLINVAKDVADTAILTAAASTLYNQFSNEDIPLHHAIAVAATLSGTKSLARNAFNNKNLVDVILPERLELSNKNDYDKILNYIEQYTEFQLVDSLIIYEIKNHGQQEHTTLVKFKPLNLYFLIHFNYEMDANILKIDSPVEVYRRIKVEDSFLKVPKYNSTDVNNPLNKIRKFCLNKPKIFRKIN